MKVDWAKVWLTFKHATTVVGFLYGGTFIALAVFLMFIPNAGGTALLSIVIGLGFMGVSNMLHHEILAEERMKKIKL